MRLVNTSYNKEDVTMLLKDLTGKIEGKDTSEREKLIQSGVHYCEMLPIEYEPSEEYLKLYKYAMREFADDVAKAVEVLSEKVVAEKGTNVVLVSLARAGTPIGILIKKYIKYKYNVDVSHYTISIIRGKGIDHNAMEYILNRHEASEVQFVDGWTGKGAILKVLEAEVSKYPGVSKDMAVLADPANICRLCGTHEDFLIPSSCLNSTVSCLFSRTVLRNDLIDVDNGDFHGAVYYEKFKDIDMSLQYIREIEQCFDLRVDLKRVSDELKSDNLTDITGLEEVTRIKEREGVHDINLVKPGIGETTRVLLRRVPWKILVKDLNDTKNIGHILRLAEEKGVEVVEDRSLQRYNCVGIIREMSDI